MGMTAVRLMEHDLEISFEIPEHHRVSSVGLEDRLRVAGPGTGNLSGNGPGNGHAVLSVFERGPKNQQLSVLCLVNEVPVGNVGRR